MRPLVLRRTAGATIVGLGLAAGVFGVLAGGGTPATATGGPAVEERASALAHFALFRQVQRTARLAPDPAVAVSARNAGIEPSDARRAALPLGAPAVSVVPRQEALCVYVTEAGGNAAYGCAPWADALAGRTYLTLSGGPGRPDGSALVAGVVPDETASVTLTEGDGTEEVEVTSGVYAVETSDPEHLTITADSGAAQTIDLSSLPRQGE